VHRSERWWVSTSTNQPATSPSGVFPLALLVLLFNETLVCLGVRSHTWQQSSSPYDTPKRIAWIVLQEIICLSRMHMWQKRERGDRGCRRRHVHVCFPSSLERYDRIPGSYQDQFPKSNQLGHTCFQQQMRRDIRDRPITSLATFERSQWGAAQGRRMVAEEAFSSEWQRRAPISMGESSRAQSS